MPTIYSAAKRVKQAPVCLLDNAAKFTREGKIVLGSSGVEGGVEILGRDTGIGIAKEAGGLSSTVSASLMTATAATLAVSAWDFTPGAGYSIFWNARSPSKVSRERA